jgi:hypothetical protein
MLKVFNGDGIYWISCLDNFIFAIENLITGCLVKGLLMMEIQEVMDTGEEPLGIEVRQFGVSTYVTVPRDHGSK